MDVMWSDKEIKNKDYFNGRRINAARKLHENYCDDPEFGRRIVQRQCKVCYYNTKICGQGFTSYTCQNCQEVSQHSNTCVPTLCGKCSRDLNVCQDCGGSI